MSKKILGLDLGTTSIGWALVNEAENEKEESKIIKTGVRIVPLSTDESDDFQKGKSLSINADRTLKRGARRNLDRYQDRRRELIKILKANNLINANTKLAESGKQSTHSLWKLRSKAAEHEISLEEFSRVLMAINKKRGYKSNRKAKDDSDGQAVDGMEIAKYLYNNNSTPGQLVYERLQEGKKGMPDFYRSDLQKEFDQIWEVQKKFYPDILSDDLKENLKGKNLGQTWKICEKPFDIKGIKIKGKRDEVKLEKYSLRVRGLSEQIELEYLAIVLQEINSQINNSSGYLGAISDRSKELYFQNLTVGQYLYAQILNNPHTRLKNQVFYRQDYLDEFEKIWSVQSQFHSELTEELKNEIRDVIIFYQRRLKSQKGLISICELEGKEVEVEIDGTKKQKLIGPRVVPKSSPLFQTYKIWQRLNDIIIRNKDTNERVYWNDILEERRFRLFDELNFKGDLNSNQVLKILTNNSKDWELNFKDGIDGNRTNAILNKAFQDILELAGYEIDLFKLDVATAKETLAEIFESLGINTILLEFNPHLDTKEFEQQKSYLLWHLLYSYEGDKSTTGNEALFKKLVESFGIEREYAKPLINVSFEEDYGNISAKAIKKLLPHLEDGLNYSEAAEHAGYKHSKHSLTKEEIEQKVLDDKLEVIQKNSLRNPVVEKILNQMVNVVNAIIDEYGKPDEIRIELARELKKTASERADMTKSINSANARHEEIRKILRDIYPFNSGVRITRNDIVKYKLYEELSSIGHKTIYTNTYIPIEKLFSKEFDIEHIIPKALLFDDSFSNKTIAVRDFNRVKSNRTGIDAVVEKYGENSEGLIGYLARIESLYSSGAISKGKFNKLKMKESEIPDGFIERDLRNSQYIAKKARFMLEKVVKKVTPTTGSITDRLRDDWQLVNVMQELNWDKYKKLGLTYYEESKDGKQIPKIKDWTKRNDHRHHAMDAIAIAFTKDSHIQYLNNLSARRNEKHEKYHSVYGIEQKETFINDKGKRLIKSPIPIGQFRKEAKEHLDNTLISFKAKNKVVTRNKNKTKKKVGFNMKVELTPRGQLHKETIYGSSKYYVSKDEKVGTKFDEERIMLVSNPSYRQALLERLKENANNPKKAFGGKNALAKRPIYLDVEKGIQVPEIVNLVWLENRFTIRKDVNPDNFKTAKNIEKVVDKGTKRILLARLKEFNNDSKKAFANLDENPIWVNEAKGIQLKRVTITGVSNAEPLHAKRDHFGNEILNNNGKLIPSAYVSTGNNHHVAIYRDDKGNLQEDVVSFYKAVARVSAGLPIINKHHEQGWEFLFTIKQNEMFVFPNEEMGFEPNEIDLMDEANYHIISPNLFRVQKIGSLLSGFWFRHHLETTVDNLKELKEISYNVIQSTKNLEKITKVRVNHIGKIVKVGEY
jgi:CRISPR-associated endonuclease Csn1